MTVAGKVVRDYRYQKAPYNWIDATDGGTRTGIVDDEGIPVSPGSTGTIAVKAPDPVFFLRYWNKPEATEEKFRNGWLLTGDTGHRDEDGYFWFHGRNDDVIISGSVSDEQAKEKYPDGWKSPKPYIRIVPQPTD